MSIVKIRNGEGNTTITTKINENFKVLISNLDGFTAPITQKSANYTITDTDGVYTLEVTTGDTDKTITLPTASANTGRVLYIAKVDSGTGDVIIDGEDSETISGDTTKTIDAQWNVITIQCNGTSWLII